MTNTHSAEQLNQEESSNMSEVKEPLLLKSISKVMAEIKRLEKRQRNDHGKYDFTSVDDYKDDVRPRLAKQNLVHFVTENSFELKEYTVTKSGKDEAKAVGVFNYSIYLQHSETLEKTDVSKQTVILPVTGAQTSGAAKSYALKEWLKSTFLYSSGDQQDEADLLEQARDGLRLGKADARELHKQLDAEINEQIDGKNKEKLADWWQENKFKIETLPKDWFIQFRLKYAEAYKTLRAEEELDRMTSDELDQLGMNAQQQKEAAE